VLDRRSAGAQARHDYDRCPPLTRQDVGIRRTLRSHLARYSTFQTSTPAAYVDSPEGPAT
jgi:hypothetical protein